MLSGYRNGVWALHSHIPDSPAGWTYPVSPSKTASRGKVLRTSIRNATGPKTNVAQHWSLPKATVWRTTQHWGLPRTHLSLLYLAPITVICLMTSSIRWPAQPSMEPPPVTVLNVLSTYLCLWPLDSLAVSPAICSAPQVTAYFFLPVSDLLPEVSCLSSWLQNLFVRAVQESFQCHFIGKDQLS